MVSHPSPQLHITTLEDDFSSSTAQHSAAQHSTAQHSTAQRSTAQRSTAQHSTAQHSTAQHSTAQHKGNANGKSTFLYMLMGRGQKGQYPVKRATQPCQ